jgi:flagellar FliJ protein
MAFRFALAPLLRLRQSLEHQRALAFQKASSHVARAQEALTRLDGFLEESAAIDSRSLAAGCMAADLHFAMLLREQLQQLRVQLQEEIRRLEALHEEAAHAYEQALAEREVLESLSARQRRAYQLEQARRQQQEIDAVFLVQRWHTGKD